MRRAASCAIVLLAACGGTSADVQPVATIELSASTIAVAAGSDAPLTARVLDGSGNELLGRTVVWSSRDETVATVTQPAALTTVVRGIAPGTTQIAANSEGRSAIVSVTVSPRSVSRVAVAPATVNLRVTGTQQLQVQTLDATGAQLAGRPVTYTTSDARIATVSNAGLVTAVAVGAATITATSEGASTLVPVTVTAIPVASVLVAPTNPTVVAGRTVQLSATALDSLGRALSGRTVSWTTSDARVASVSSTGLVSGLAAGTARITATFDGVSGSQQLTVTLTPVAGVTVSAGKTTMIVGDTTLATARLTDAAGNVLTGRVVAFASDAPSVATVNATTGVVTAVNAGTANISATSEGVRGSITLRVNVVPVASVTVSPPTSTIVTGGTVALTATAKSAGGATITGRPVSWTSGAPTIVSVASDGTVKGLAAGTAIVFASVDGVLGQATVNVSPSVASVTVTPSPGTVQVGRTLDLTATARDVGGNIVTGRTTTWSSNDPTIATVSSAGRVTGVKIGTVTITATTDGVTGAAAVVVLP